MNEIERQERNGNFVAREIYCCQSALVDSMLEQGIFNYEDIENFYYTYEEASDNGMLDDDINEETYEQEPKEIYEWWVCSDWLIERLRERGEPILSNDYGDWWGRTCTGQAIKLDHIIDRIIERK